MEEDSANRSDGTTDRLHLQEADSAMKACQEVCRTLAAEFKK